MHSWSKRSLKRKAADQVFSQLFKRLQAGEGSVRIFLSVFIHSERREAVVPERMNGDSVQKRAYKIHTSFFYYKNLAKPYWFLRSWRCVKKTDSRVQSIKLLKIVFSATRIQSYNMGSKRSYFRHIKLTGLGQPAVILYVGKVSKWKVWNSARTKSDRSFGYCFLEH